MGAKILRVGNGKYNVWDTRTDAYWFEEDSSKLEVFEYWEKTLLRKSKMEFIEAVMSFDKNQKKGSFDGRSEAYFEGLRAYHEWAKDLHDQEMKDETFDIDMAIDAKIQELKKQMEKED